MKKNKILHITDAFGGGVITAIDTYVSFSNNCEHYLLTSAPKFEKDNAEILNKFFSYDIQMSSNRLKAMKQINQAYRELNPDYVHLHSSFAGFYGRLLSIPSEKIIYTPHGYSFQRKDISIVLRKFFYVSEWILTKISKKSIIAACGPGEYKAASTMSKDVVLLSNYADVPKNIIWKSNNIIDKNICMVGRICPQKGIDFFIETYKILQKDSNIKYKFVWIGDGDELLKKELIKNNIQILGWKKKNTVLEILSKQNVNFYTAAWDGLPISLLEASIIGLPLVVRETEATEFLSPLTYKTAKEAAKGIINICENKSDLSLNKKNKYFFY